ncbi:hypothetical protein [Lederbergia galactosidilytica]|uniref:Uncharacterized protein n=1 Tax=Lederbergia galactosidilytica TaxID=217031 RepID=A0A177ZXP1_9BACI|nr:hypothetical protein [Lederbergia galactosidilytica]OAK72695.1 hypothetical protein ABB05_07515 [Lederbergia galactosidilytica]
MQKVLVIVTQNGTKYQFGIRKSVSEVVNEVAACKSDYYQVLDTCAIKISEILSIEQFEYDPNAEEGNEDDQA